MQKVRLYSSLWIRILCIVLCILWAALIFSMSAEVRAESGARSGRITKIVIAIFFPNFEELGESERAELASKVDHVVRKIAHFCIYGMLGILICLASVGYFAKWRTHLFRTAIIGAAYATSDEIHQCFVPGRGPGVKDVLLDSVGVICGGVFVLIIITFIFKLKSRRQKWNVL